MRLFAAILPPLEVRRDLRASFGELPALEGLRLHPAGKIHLTLAFFGDAGPQRRRLGQALGEVAARTAPFELVVGGGSGFPATEEARALFVAVPSGGAALSALHDDLMATLGPDLVAGDRDRFHPHLTLCRPRRLARGQFAAFVEQARPWSWSFAVDALHLVCSHPEAGSSRYEVLESHGLGG